MSRLIENFGARAFVAPSMQELPLDQNPEAVSGIRSIVDGRVDSVVLMTGVGTKALLALADVHGLQDALLQRLSEIPLFVRGPKPAAELTKLKLKWAIKAPDPNTWRELISALDDSQHVIKNTTIAVQEYGAVNPEFHNALSKREAEVLSLPVYRWALPDDVSPLQEAIRRTIDGHFSALMFTSAQQLRHVVQVAEEMKLRTEWLTAAKQVPIASIGPTCSETLSEFDLPIAFEASPPKMGPLARGATDLVQAQG